MKKSMLDGQRFGELTVIKYSTRRGSNALTYWLCRCDCGRTFLVRTDNLLSGRTSRCSECKKTGGFKSVFCEEGENDGEVND